MCGIAGYFGKSESEALLRDMTNALAHRGPDGSNLWQDDRVGLGHRRLAIIDLHSGDQPMWDAAKEHVIVFNGEIYNYPELKRELESRGHVFKTSSDTEVIPAVIREWGIEQGLLRLRGMFSFALYNVNTKRLLLARDRVGIKPMYWTQKDGALYFASEEKALLLPGLAERRIDPIGIHDYLTIGHPIAPRTCWADIKFLPPGSWMEIGADGRQRQGVYWQWTPKPDNRVSEEEWLNRLEETLSDSLRCHLLSDVPLGAFLSGGIDSSLVVAMLARHHVKDLDTFNVTFDESGYDESLYASQVAELYHTRHHKIPVSMNTATPETLVRCIQQFDEPFGDPASLPNFLLSQVTTKQVKVVLSGDGGDEILGGYPQHLRLRKIAPLVNLQWADSIAQPLLRAASRSPLRLPHQLAKAWEHAQGSLAERIVKLMTLYSERGLTQTYTDSFREAALAGGPTSNRISPYLLDETLDPLDQMLAVELRIRLQGGYLRKVDVTSSAFGLEIRPPMLDNAMLEFSEALPNRFKIKGSQLKYLAYRLARRYLPAEIVNRPKHGFDFPFDQWSSSPQVQAFLKDLLFAPNARWRAILQPSYVDDYWAVISRQRTDPAISRLVAYGRVYFVTALELWLQKWNPLI
ncbi:MAG: asparagine synthase (glutamine-hydrolyzing) [Anaerolineales bacterium]|nr:asparagine synthase (glutamine-hydrolyzing) [Anaerolineales bacterium]